MSIKEDLRDAIIYIADVNGYEVDPEDLDEFTESYRKEIYEFYADKDVDPEEDVVLNVEESDDKINLNMTTTYKESIYIVKKYYDEGLYIAGEEEE